MKPDLPRERSIAPLKEAIPQGSPPLSPPLSATRSLPLLVAIYLFWGTIQAHGLQQERDAKEPNRQAVRRSQIKVFELDSPNQAGPTEVHVLAPTEPVNANQWRVLYLLPVEKLDGQKWGNALDEILQHDLHNRFGLLCVYPTFSNLPWFANHPTDPEIQQEKYLLQCVLPLIDKEYGIPSAAENRFLIGFSKSGYGAWSLLLRNPNLFSKAAAWDAPLMMQEPNRYGMGPIYGSLENFHAYQITELLKIAHSKLGSRTRLVHGGYANFKTHHQEVDEMIRSLQLKSHFQDGPARAHSWNSGWLAPLLKELVGPEDKPSKKFP